MLTTIKGLVVREMSYGDNDKILHILTGEKGRLAVIAKGAKSIKNRYMTACQLFAYSSFNLYVPSNGTMCRLKDAELIQSFYEIRSSIETLSLASYISDVASQVSTEHNEEDGILSLALNTLYILSKMNHPLYIVKGVFELRLMSVAGFMPDLVACGGCSCFTCEYLYLDTINGDIICQDCFAKRDNTREFGAMIRVSGDVLTALRHIIYSQTNKIFSFTLTQDQHDMFSLACERYLLDQVGHSFSTLSYYKQIMQLQNERTDKP